MVVDYQGDYKDIMKLLYLSKDSSEWKGIKINYVPKFQISFSDKNNKFLAFYNIESDSCSDKLVINNYDPFRKKVSVRNLDERQYIIKKEENSNIFKLIISNAPNCRKEHTLENIIVLITDQPLF
ncbi:hypothetical protein QNI16_30350 [Cytophagaceae bacterium YF14B1]|uniref:Uncharacterized protein n=1 Tax=Xanthocytophaga flava TaxID=3048013 RepID=A0AAE3QX94_9BACT|nr:hypothetical protein [Xanthocytophaga flavus]MDJ1484840.1 hypothetical protein [Xanthocytophaga flavus]